MSAFNLLTATQAIEKSMPFVLYRFLLYFGAGLGFLLATLAGAGTLVGFAFLSKNANALGPVGAVLGFAAFGFLMYKLRPSGLHGIKAPHLAVLAAQAKGEPLPPGKALIDFAKQRLGKNFPSTTKLFELDRNIQVVLRDIVDTARPTAALAGTSWAASLLTQAMGYLYARNHQSILAWHFYAGSDDGVRTAVNALPVQKQHYSLFLQQRIYATVFELLGFVAAVPLLSIGFGKIVSGIPIAFGVWPEIFAAVFAWTLKAAFFEPIAEAAMMQAFFPLAGKGPDPEQQAALARHSEAYRAMLRADGKATP